MITLHHLNYSRSLRILWLLEELELDYKIQYWERDKTFRAPKSAKEYHSLGRFPMIEVDDRVLAESGAILEYFADREKKLKPVDEDDALACRFFLHYGEGSLMAPLLVQLIVEKVKAAKVPFFVRPIVKNIAQQMERGYPKPEIENHFSFIEKHLSENEYFSGSMFSIADIQMYYGIEAGFSRGQQDHRKAIAAWLEMMKSRRAFERALEKGGPAMPPS